MNLPRLDLPDPVVGKLGEYDLKNPNEMTEEEYRGYSGAAILGTLLFLLPGGLIFDIPDEISDVLSAAAVDFGFSALTGGVLAIYLALRGDEIG